MSIKVIRYRLPSYWACPLINDDYTGLTDEECEEIHKIQDMERLNFETLFRVVRWDYNRCFKDESLDKDLFVEKYGRVMGEHYYNKFVHEFDENIPFPVSTWERSYRYKGYGYNMCRETKKKLLQAIKGVNVEEKDVSLYTTGGWD